MLDLEEKKMGSITVGWHKGSIRSLRKKEPNIYSKSWYVILFSHQFYIQGPLKKDKGHNTQRNVYQSFEEDPKNVLVEMVNRQRLFKSPLLSLA